MARYDKYDPMVGGFRAPLAADWLPADLNKPVGVGHNASGEIVKGAGTSGIVGVLILTKARKASEIVDTMTAGEITEFGGDPGTVYFSDTAGVVSKVSAAGKTRVGHTVEGGRLICRVGGVVAA